uniref:Uncharacterized protein n=1 Tax=Sphaerodactylus townsendi TaxID=933632 RepID=A0ACB8FCC0_9SAUR
MKEDEALKSETASAARLVKQTAPRCNTISFGRGLSAHSSPFGSRMFGPDNPRFGQGPVDYKSVQWTIPSEDVPAVWYSNYGCHPMDYTSSHLMDPGGSCSRQPWEGLSWYGEDRCHPGDPRIEPDSHWAELVQTREERSLQQEFQKERHRAQVWPIPTVCMATAGSSDKGSDADTGAADSWVQEKLEYKEKFQQMQRKMELLQARAKTVEVRLTQMINAPAYSVTLGFLLQLDRKMNYKPVMRMVTEEIGLPPYTAPPVNLWRNSLISALRRPRKRMTAEYWDPIQDLSGGSFPAGLYPGQEPTLHGAQALWLDEEEEWERCSHLTHLVLRNLLNLWTLLVQWCSMRMIFHYGQNLMTSMSSISTYIRLNRQPWNRLGVNGKLLKKP